MKIGMDARLLYYRIGGTSTYIRGLLGAFKQLDKHHDVTVLLSRKMKGNAGFDDYRTAKLLTPSHHRIERTALSLELLRFNFDVHHAPDFIPPRRGGRRHVITVMDLSFLHFPEFMTIDSQQYYNQQIADAVQHADHILTISEATKTDLIDMLKVPSEKISVQLLAANHLFYPRPHSEIDSVLEKYGLPKDYFLFVGTFEPRKNIDGLVKAYRQLIDDSNGDVPKLVLVGNPGWLFDDIRKNITAQKIDDYLIWCEGVPVEDLPRLYSGAIALLMPSIYEGFGFPVLEAMQCGTPPITSNVSSLPEVAGDVGLLVNPHDTTEIADAMRYVMDHPDWRQEQTTLALQRAKKFTWEEAASVALRAYAKAMEN